MDKTKLTAKEILLRVGRTSEKSLPFLVEAMEEHAQNQVNAYKEELRKEIENLMKHHTKGGRMIQHFNDTKEYILSEEDMHSLLDKPQDQ